MTFLTTIWGEGVVFTWLLNLTGISALIVWGFIGVISLRFRKAYRAQGRDISDLPYRQPLFPLLPAAVVVLAVVMFVAEGYAATKEDPFEAKVCFSFLILWFLVYTKRRTLSRHTSELPYLLFYTLDTHSGNTFISRNDIILFLCWKWIWILTQYGSVGKGQLFVIV